MAEFTRRVELVITAKDEASAVLDAIGKKAKGIRGGGAGGGGGGWTARVQVAARAAETKHQREMTKIILDRNKQIADHQVRMRALDLRQSAQMDRMQQRMKATSARVGGGAAARVGGRRIGGGGGGTAASSGSGIFADGAGMLGAMSGTAAVLMGVLNAVGNVATQVAGVVRETIGNLIEISSNFEQNQIAIAGTMQALGFGKDFAESLAVANSTLDEITAKSAVLPGQAEEYISVFRAGLPVIQKVLGNNTDAISDFTNKFTAVGKMARVATPQIGRDLARMMAMGAGRTGAMTKTFTAILPYLRTLDGQANITTMSFNRMSEAKRFDLISQAMGKMDGALKASATTWDAMSGTLKSIGRMMLRIGGAEVFSGLKDLLGWVNDQLVDSKGHFTEFGQAIVDAGKLLSENLVWGMRQVVGYALELKATFASLGLDKLGGGIGEAMGGIGRALGGNVKGSSAVAGGVAGTMAGGAPGMVLGLAFADFAQRLAPMGAVVTSLASIFQRWLGVLEPGIGMLSTFATLLGDMLEGVLPPLMAALDTLLEPIFLVVAYLYDLASSVMNQVRPALASMWAAIGEVVTALSEALKPILSLFGIGVENLADSFATVLVGAINTAADVIKAFASAVAAVIRFMAKFIPGIDLPSGGTHNQAAVRIADTHKYSYAEGAGGDQAALAAAAGVPGGRGGNTTLQDFRYSRFDITQKYDAGYDPDRILLAFTDDLQRVGEAKLQSAMEQGIPLR